MATIKDIAERAGVSRGTVDRVLNNRGRVNPEKEALIRKIAEELNYSPNIIGRTLSLKKKNILFVFCYLKSEFFPYVEILKKGVEFHDSKFKDFGVKVEYLPFDSDLSHEEVVNSIIIPYMETHSVDGWLMDGLKADALCNVLESQNKEIPPIFTYILDSTSPKTIGYVGCNYSQVGRVACSLANILSNSNAKVGILSYSMNMLNISAQCIDAFNEEIHSQYPNVEILDNFVLPFGKLSEDMCEKIAKDIASNKNINTLFAMNPGDYSIFEYINKYDKNHTIKVIVFDLPNDYSKNLMRNNIIDVAICQELFKTGAMALGYLFNFTMIDTNASKRIVHETGLQIIIKENIDSNL